MRKVRRAKRRGRLITTNRFAGILRSRSEAHRCGLRVRLPLRCFFFLAFKRERLSDTSNSLSVLPIVSVEMVRVIRSGRIPILSAFSIKICDDIVQRYKYNYFSYFLIGSFRFVTLTTTKCKSRRICTADIVISCKGMIFGPITFAKFSMLILFCFSYKDTFLRNSIKNAKVLR